MVSTESHQNLLFGLFGNRLNNCDNIAGINLSFWHSVVMAKIAKITLKKYKYVAMVICDECFSFAGEERKTRIETASAVHTNHHIPPNRRRYVVLTPNNSSNRPISCRH